MVLRIQIAKFKFHQYLLRANSLNLKLAKLSRYVVCRLNCNDAFDHFAADTVGGPNYNLIIILVLSIVGSLALITIAVSIMIVFVHWRRRRRAKTMEFPLQITK